MGEVAGVAGWGVWGRAGWGVWGRAGWVMSRVGNDRVGT